MQHTDGNKCDELYQRISYLERELECAQKEAYELREQNELLEFRNIELEESFEKVRVHHTHTHTHIPCVHKKYLLNEPITIFLSSPLPHQLLPPTQYKTNPQSKQQQNTVDSRDPVDTAWRPVAASSAPHAERMVATVQPYSTLSPSDGSDRKPKATASANHCTQCTQTDIHDICDATDGGGPTGGGGSPADHTSAELCAEIQKLNRFRKKIEQCTQNASDSAAASPAVAKLLGSASASADARRLQFYKDRLEQLENKVLVYESTGDAQMRRLADRLQRELQLDACVKQLTERVGRLAHTNRQLEEEKCEFEEAENDARHLLQKLEIEVEMVRQRNAELEQMGEAARAHANCLEDTVASAHERIQILEEHKSDLKEKLDMLTSFLPAMMLCTEWKDGGGGGRSGAGVQRMDTGDDDHDNDGGDDGMADGDDSSSCRPIDLPDGVCQCIHSQLLVQATRDQTAEVAELQRLMERERTLKHSIDRLNRAYGETLENADTVWAQLESDYRQQLAEAHEECTLLKAKIYQLEDRLQSDAVCAGERIGQLEEAEALLQRQLAKSGREQRQHAAELLAVRAEYEALADKYAGLKGYLNGPMASCVEKERRRADAVQEELRTAAAAAADADEGHRERVAQLRGQLNRTKKELLYIHVSNGELKEEVDTLEHRLVELEAQRRRDEETIRGLSDELRQPCESRQSVHTVGSDSEDGRRSVGVQRSGGGGGETLAQELQQAAGFGACTGQQSASLVRSADATDDEDEEEEFEEAEGEDRDQFGAAELTNIGCYMSRTEL